MTGQLATFTGLGALGHLDLDVVGLGEIQRGDAKATRGHLFDGRASHRVKQTVLVLSALTRVRPGAKAVHRHGDRLVSLLADGPIAHRPGAETCHDRGDRLDLVDGHRRATPSKLEQAAQRHQPLGLLINPRGVLLEDVVPASSGGVLQTEYGLRVEQVGLALTAPLVFPTHVQLAVRQMHGIQRVCRRVARRHLLGNDLEPNSSKLRDRPGEVGVDQLVREPDGFEYLRTAI